MTEAEVAIHCSESGCTESLFGDRGLRDLRQKAKERHGWTLRIVDGTAVDLCAAHSGSQEETP